MGLTLNQAREVFGSLDKISTGGRNDVKPGRIKVLINSVEMAQSREFKPFLRTSATVLVPVSDGAGRLPGQEGYAGHFKGEEVSFCFFFGDRFAKDFGPFLCAALGLSSEDAKSLTGEELRETALSIVRCDDKPNGALDGNTVIEMHAEESAPAADKKNPGQLRTFINNRFDRHVPLSSLVEEMEEKDLALYFGSLENYAKMVEVENT